MEKYLEKLSPDEIRMALRLWVWKEKDDEMLRKQLEFFCKELTHK